MSAQLKEKEQPLNLRREEKADYLFNQHIVRTVAYTGAGFGFGLLASLLFKHKAGMTLFFAGTGAGYGGANFVNDLKVFRRNKNWTTPSQNAPNKLERKVDEVKEGAKEGAEDLSKRAANKVNEVARGVEQTGKKVSEKLSK